MRSVKQECLSKLILFREVSLRRALNEFIEHYHAELNNQARATFCCSPPRRVGGEGRSPAANDSADCSDTTAAPHDYFGYTPTQTVISVLRRPGFLLREGRIHRTADFSFILTAPPASSPSQFPRTAFHETHRGP